MNPAPPITASKEWPNANFSSLGKGPGRQSLSPRLRKSPDSSRLESQPERDLGFAALAVQFFRVRPSGAKLCRLTIAIGIEPGPRPV